MPGAQFNLNLGRAEAPNAAARGVAHSLVDAVEGVAKTAYSSRESRQDKAFKDADRAYQHQRQHFSDQLKYEKHVRGMFKVEATTRTEEQRTKTEKARTKGQKNKNVGYAADSSSKEAKAASAWNETNARAPHEPGIAESNAKSQINKNNIGVKSAEDLAAKKLQNSHNPPRSRARPLVNKPGDNLEESPPVDSGPTTPNIPPGDDK